MAIRKYPRKDPDPEKPKGREYGWNSTGANYELTKQVEREIFAVNDENWKPWTLIFLPCGVPVLPMGELI